MTKTARGVDCETAKLTSKSQCTVPKSVRDYLGLKPGDEIDFVKDAEGRLIVKRHIEGNPFEQWAGYAKHLAGVDVDELIREMRGE